VRYGRLAHYVQHATVQIAQMLLLPHSGAAPVVFISTQRLLLTTPQPTQRFIRSRSRYQQCAKLGELLARATSALDQYGRNKSGLSASPRVLASQSRALVYKASNLRLGYKLRICFSMQ
jgi:hypothetical protein